LYTYDAQEDTSIGVVTFSAEGPSTKDGVYSFVAVVITRGIKVRW
jgi:hypothetical protein